MKFSDCLRAGLGAALLAGTALLLAGCERGADGDPAPDANSVSNAPAPTSVELTGDQLNSVKIAPVRAYEFSVEKTGIGTVDFENNLYSEPDLSTEVLPPAPGKISKIFVELGDEVKKGQPLYSLSVSDTNPAELVVRSPLGGQVTSVNATPGLNVDPSVPPGPCAVADVSQKWLLANVSEADSPFFQMGQPMKVTVAALPGKVFRGRIIKIYPTVDVATHRLSFRARISDPANDLRSGMLADFSAEVRKPARFLAIPENGVVREGDGTMTAWVTTDRQHFTQRIIKIGLRENGQVQILDGLKQGELTVTDGAIFLDNMLQAPVDD